MHERTQSSWNLVDRGDAPSEGTLVERQIERLIEGLSTIRVLEKEAFSRLVRNTLGVRKVSFSELPYKIDDKTFKGFPSRNTIFSRTSWDPRIRKLARMLRDRRLKKLKVGAPGFTTLDYALSESSWALSRVHRLLLKSQVPRIKWQDLLPGRRKLSSLLTLLVKRVALFFGADLVGVAEVDRRWIYTDVKLPEHYRHVIILAFEMDLAAIERANEGPYAAEVGFGYSRMSTTALLVSEFLRILGFRALPQGNEGALSIPLAVLAGLGEVGRSGLLITPEYGPRVRLAKVFTDAPLIPDCPVRFGVLEFCRECQRCALECPAGAIPLGGPTWNGPTVSEEKGVYKWHVNHELCYRYWAEIGGSCGICIKVCPYSERIWDYHRVLALREAIRTVHKKP